jgi:type VI secretion system protein ImpA
MTPAERACDVAALLAPIAGAQPAGADIRYAPIYEKIKAARRTADDKQQGRTGLDSDDTVKPEERAAAAREFWFDVQSLVMDALTGQSKDLQLAVWLTESRAYTHGFSGAATGVEVMRGLIETYWDGLYPPVDAEDDEPLALRTGVMEWLNERLPAILKSVPLTSGSRRYSLADYELAQKATGERAKAELAEAGRPTADQFTHAVAASSLQHLEALAGSIDGCLAQINDLEKVTDTKFVARTATASGERLTMLVAFGEVRKALEDCKFQVGRALRAKAPRDAGAGAGSAPGTSDSGALAATGDGFWDRALQLVRQGQLEGLRLAQDHIDAASSGRERFLRQLQLSELCIQAGMHAFAYPILDELGKIIDARDLVSWEDHDLIRRTWSGLASVCKPLARFRPESAAREAEALSRLSVLSGAAAPDLGPTDEPSDPDPGSAS